MNPRYLLLPFSWLYGAVMNLRNFWYDRKSDKVYRAPVPVISVGNLSTGGTGKTPMAEFLLAYFRDHHDLKAAYLSRGYGRKTRGYLRVPAGEGTAASYGDEALQVAHKFPSLPVAVCEDRREGIRRLVEEEGAALIVLDDALQHRKVARDLDIVLLDAQRLPDRDAVLPAGNLREPLKGLHRADLLIVNKLEDPQKIPEIRRRLGRWNKPMAFATPEFEGLHSFWGDTNLPFPPASALAFSGLGNNAFFFEQIQASGVALLEHFSFPDHYAYKEQDIAKIVLRYHEHSKKTATFASPLLLTTEKDYFRLRETSWLAKFRALPLYYVSIRLRWWEGENELLQQLDDLANGKTS